MRLPIFKSGLLLWGYLTVEVLDTSADVALNGGMRRQARIDGGGYGDPC